MANTGTQHSRKHASRKNLNPMQDALQGTDDTQSEFSVNEIRAERREHESQADEQSKQAAPAKDSDAADTESEFSVNEKLRGQS